MPGLGFKVSGSGFWVLGFRFRVSGFENRDSGFGFQVSGLGFRAVPGSVKRGAVFTFAPDLRVPGYLAHEKQPPPLGPP